MNRSTSPLELVELACTADHSDRISDAQIVRRWLAMFERALHEGSDEGICDLFTAECHWRDMFAFTWTISPCDGKAKIVEQLLENQGRVRASGFAIAKDSIAPRRVKRGGITVLEAIIAFETAFSRCKGIVRLLPDEQRAWVLLTSLRELKGYEEHVGARRPDGSAYNREFGGPNWADRRAREQEFADRDPAVLIVGAGQTGLTTAARLRALGVDALCVDKHERVGDSWRKRYHSLALHNQVALNQMAYMPFPETWPKYISKDMLANWLEHYAWALECNVWLSSTLLKARYDTEARHWEATVRRGDGTERTLKPRHLVFANGIVGAPTMPRFAGLSDFNGRVFHTHDYQPGEQWRGRNVLVIGAGTSGHDVAQDLFGHGANVKIVQRGSTSVASLDAVALGFAVYYNEQLSTEDADLITQCATYPVAVRNAQMLTKAQNKLDERLLSGLQARGFKLDSGPDGTGYLMKIRRRHGGYYYNCGCSELIVEGKIGVLQFEDIDRFVGDGALMKDGHVEKADLVVTATGYQPQQEVVRELLGNEIAEQVGPIWGIDSDGELRNMYKPTAQSGLWFLGSGLSQARIFTHYVALQIKARELGLVSNIGAQSLAA